MAQDTTPAIIVYQGDGSNSVFDVPFDKGYYGDIKVLFVRRGLADYTYNPTTFTVSGRLYAWQNGGAKIYTHTPNPAIGAPTYNSSDVEQAETVSAIAGQTITVDSLVYSRAVQHDISSNMKLTWTGDTLDVGDFICIVRDTERDQPYEMPNNQKHIERALDNIERQVQEVKDATDNALKIDPSHDIPDSHKMNPIDWLKSIIRCMDFSVRALRYANGWLDYSLDDPNIADADKTWVHLLNTDNIKAVREQNRIEDGETIYWTEYLAQDGTWKILSDPHKWDNMKLSDLADTDFTNLQTNQFLKFNGTKWVNVSYSSICGWGGIIGTITDQTDLMAEFAKYVRTDGSSIMTNPLMMRATEDFKCAIAPYWDGVGFFKLNDNNSVTLMASIEYNSGFEPATTNTYNIGASTRKWKNLYLSGKAYMSVINNGYDIAVPVTNSADTLALVNADINPLQQQINHLQTIGRFLSFWDATTGLAQTNPPESPYTYHTGDYFRVGVVASGGGTNYKPTGSSYTTGVASTVVEINPLTVGQVYYYDGTNWALAAGGSIAIDGMTIVFNSDNEIQAVAVVDQNTGIVKTWTGTAAEYEAIATKDPDTEYIITDDIGDSATIIGEITEDVNELKAHEVIAFQAPTAQNNYTWYRKYADGWVEQGGTDTSASEDLSVTLPVTMANDKYQVQLTLGNTTRSTFANQYWSTFGWQTKTTTGFTCTVNVANAGTKDWYVYGMAA